MLKGASYVDRLPTLNFLRQKFEHTPTLEKKEVFELESGVFAKDKEIKKEISKLKKIFGDLEGRNKEVSLKLIEELAFLMVEMKNLKQHVKQFGSVDEMEQGEYTILRTSPYYKNYLDAAKTYTTLYKQILDLYPKGDGPKVDELDELQSFLKKHSK